jgi:hypothetical protein
VRSSSRSPLIPKGNPRRSHPAASGRRGARHGNVTDECPVCCAGRSGSRWETPQFLTGQQRQRRQGRHNVCVEGVGAAEGLPEAK